MIIQAEISLDLSNAVDKCEMLVPLLDAEVNMSSDVVQVDRLSQTNKLGNMRLASIELIEKAMTYFGIKMLKTFEDADLFSTADQVLWTFPIQ